MSIIPTYAASTPADMAIVFNRLSLITRQYAENIPWWAFWRLPEYGVAMASASTYAAAAELCAAARPIQFAHFMADPTEPMYAGFEPHTPDEVIADALAILNMQLPTGSTVKLHEMSDPLYFVISINLTAR